MLQHPDVFRNFEMILNGRSSEIAHTAGIDALDRNELEFAPHLPYSSPLMMKPSTRRSFIQRSSATALSAPFFAIGQTTTPSETIHLGFIGVGGHGHGYNLKSFLQEKDCRAVAACDVFKSRTERAVKTIDSAYGDTHCKGYGDYREVLAREDIDAVVISTPDHWHVPIARAALEAGKDVFCEKPSLTIAEGRVLVEEVKKRGKVFQCGLEDRSVMPYYKLAEAVRNGSIGELRHVEIELPAHTKRYVEQKQDPPEDLDWNMWLGPAPWASYSPQRVDWMGWRMLKDYSGGILTDWGAHILDTAQVANFSEHSGPVQIKGHGSIDEGVMNTAMQHFDITYTYANGVTMHVKSGGVRLKFEGSEGWCGNNGWRGTIQAHDRRIFARKYEDSKIWPLPPTEHRNFLDCVKSRKSTTYTAEDFHRLSSALHLGNIAMTLKRPLSWDPVTEAFKDDAEADALCCRSPRDWANTR